MSPSALVMMLTTCITVTAITLYFVWRVLTAPMHDDNTDVDQTPGGG